MKLHLAQTPGLLTFSSHGNGFVSINGTPYEGSVIVCGRDIVDRWAPLGFDGLDTNQFELLANMNAEIVLFGSGERQRFPRPELIKALVARGVSLEVMDTKAACRTYNILVAEGRHVACGILIPPPSESPDVAA